MDELLQEYVDSRGATLRVDRAASVIRGVKLLGIESRNGRKYLPAALSAAAGLYEGAKVNINHPKGHPLSARDYQDRLGAIRSVAVRGGVGLFGDLHFNPKHALAEQLMWDAEHAPENLGLSHNVEARTARQGNETVVEAILKVQSVDLVADPATTRSLFESSGAGSATAFAGASGDPPQIVSAALAGLTLAELRRQRPDLVELMQEQLDHEVRALREELDALRAQRAVGERRVAIRQLLSEFRLPDPDLADAAGRAIVSQTFVESLLAAPSDSAMRRLVEERAALVSHAARWSEPAGERRPQSREQQHCNSLLPAVEDAASFALSIR